MNIKYRLTIIAAAAALAAPALATDQNAGQKSNVPLHGQSQVFFRADKLVGRDAQTPVGQDLGKLSDIAFNPEKGIYGIVKAKNDQMVALPWSLVTAVTDKAIVFNTSAEAMTKAPSFTDKEWAKLNQPQFTQQIDAHFQQGAMGGSSGTKLEGQNTGASSSSASQPPPESTANQGASEPEAGAASATSASPTNSPASQ